MVTGRIDQASNFSEKPHKNPDRFHLIGQHHSFSSLRAEFVNRNMQLHVTGSGYDYLVDIPKDARRQRKAFRKNRKQYLQQRAEANRPENIRNKAREVINVVGEMIELGLDKHIVPDDGYRGCGVYRIAISNGKITATLYGGYHNSCPTDIDLEKWVPVVREELEKHGTVVKADGSGTQFFLREQPQPGLIETKEYNVPAPHGDGSHGLIHHNIQVK